MSHGPLWLKRDLTAKLNRSVVVGNISAGSWGPPNLYAYVNQHGLFDADFIIIVLGSEDYADALTFAPLGYDKPTRKPMLALEEVMVRYVPAPYLWLFEDITQ